MANEYDAIVVGAGHNGLVAANYLARGGLNVAVVEARNVVGGACVSEELIPGATWSSCAFIKALFRDEIMEELELERHGLVTYVPDVQGFALFDDGTHLFLWKELDRTLREIEKYSKKDAENFVVFGARLKRFGEILERWLLTPPPTRSEVFRAFEEEGEEELLDEFMLGSASDLIDKYFQSPHIRGLLTFYSVVSVWGGPSSPGTGYVYGHHASGSHKGVFGQWAFVKGGMGGITRALANAAKASGVTIRTSTPVEQVLVRGGHVEGVRLVGGEELKAPIVVSNADPKRSLLKLLPPGELEVKFRDDVAGIDQRGSMARIHLLIDELPHYVGFPDASPGPQHRGHQMIGCSVPAFEKAWDAQRRGIIPDDFAIEAIIQSVTDDSLCEPGMHTMTLGVQQLPVELAQGTWDDVRESWADRVCEALFRYAPNLRNHIRGRHVITPLDLEREYNLTGGNIFQSAMSLEQLFAVRSLPELGHYRTPVAGYYLCGAGTHPGGGVMGAPGHNAAHVVLADLKGEEVVVPNAAKQQRGFTQRMLESKLGRSAAYKAARSRVLRGVVSQFTKTK